jgi:AhpD family alkylhydroperoxidase
MQARLEAAKVAPGAYHAMLQLQKYVDGTSLEPLLLELVKMRASQINGCAYCIDMHAKDAIALGEDPLRLLALDAWEETPSFSERERAALAWTEAVTLVHQGHVPDEVFEHARSHFSDQELVNLTMAIVAINAWNRLAIPFRAVPGLYQSPHAKKQSPSAEEPARPA